MCIRDRRRVVDLLGGFQVNAADGVDELRDLGARDVTVSENAYVTAWIPASEGAENRPCLLYTSRCV